jgi:hypothetical protein
MRHKNNAPLPRLAGGECAGLGLRRKQPVQGASVCTTCRYVLALSDWSSQRLMVLLQL